MEADLRNAFYGDIEAYAAIQNIKASFPSVDFVPPTGNDALYLKASVLPTTPEVLGVCGGVSRHIWILQVSIRARKGVGEVRVLEQADLIRTAFPVTHIFTSGGNNFTVITPPSPLPPIPIDGWLSTPVQFRVSTII